MRRRNRRHGLIAAAREVCNATRRLGDGSRLILCQRVRGSVRAVRAVRNTRVFQTETGVVADAHLQKVVNLTHSVQIPFCRLFLHFRVVFCGHGIQFRVSAFQNPVIGLSTLPYNHFFAKGLACGFSLPPANNISAKGKTGLHSDTMWHEREYVARHI